MDLGNQLNSLNHHAYAIIGSDSIQNALIEVLVKQHGIALHGNQDFINRTYSNFTIDDAREVKAIHLTRPVTENGKKIFILTMDAITVEAQNALLKLLEEPAGYAHFFIVIPSAHLLLPTVKSRMKVLRSGTDHREVSSDKAEVVREAAKFLESSAAKRLEIVKKLMDDITKEKRTKQDAIDFLNAIQGVVYRSKGAKNAHKALETIETARKYMNDRSPSVKMLLEYIAVQV